MIIINIYMYVQREREIWRERERHDGAGFCFKETT